jgi:N-acetylglutamate synthase-like GNAT family acetyltransferase
MNQKNKFSELRFRKAQLSDATLISQLVNSAYRGPISKQGWTTEADILDGQRTDPQAIEEMIQKPHQFFLLGELNGKLLASVLLEQTKPEICYFGMFAVDPNLQTQGIGKLFIQEAERLAREELGAEIMEMTVITLRSELIAWYERRGYQKTGEVRPFPYDNQRFGIPLRDDIELGVLQKRL